MDGFQDLPRQFGQVWSSKIQWIEFFAGSTGGEMNAFALRLNYPELLSGNLRCARLGLIKWLKYSPRKTLRGKLPVRYQGLTLRFAVNVDYSFLNTYLD